MPRLEIRKGEANGDGSGEYGGEPGDGAVRYSTGRFSALRRAVSGADRRAGASVARAPADCSLSGPPHSRAAAPACGHRGSGFGRGGGVDGRLLQVRPGQKSPVPQLCAVPHPGSDSGQFADAGLESARAAPQGPRGGRGDPGADGAGWAMRRTRPRWLRRWRWSWRSISSCWAI